MTYQSTKDAPVLNGRGFVGSYLEVLLCEIFVARSPTIPNVAECEGGCGSNVYTHTILSSAPEAKYLPLVENRTVWIVPE